MGSSRDTHYLEQRNLTWYVVKAVPEQLWPKLGRRQIRSLQTHDLTVAQKERHAVLAAFQQQIDNAGRVAPMGSDELTASALEAREVLNANNLALDPEELGIHIIERTDGRAAAQSFWKTATGTGTPMRHHVDAWLQEAAYPPKSQAGHRGTLAELERFCRDRGEAPDLEAVTRRMAGGWVVAQIAAGSSRTTVNKKLSTFRPYWKWLVARDHVAATPWTEIRLPKPKVANPDEEVRPLSEAELLTLLHGGADGALLDFIKIGALTGMRLESIAQLRVADCRERNFNIRRDKTKSGTRRVPIHPDLEPIVAARSVDRAGTAWLFDLPTNGVGQRSSAMSKSFRRYRLKLGVDEVPVGNARSLVNFHSLRHRFITRALQAGQDDAVVQQVVGQKAQSVLRKVYFGGDLMAKLRACVECVRLPTEASVKAEQAAEMDGRMQPRAGT